MNRYALAYCINDGDPQPIPNAPDTVSRVEGRGYLRDLRIACKRKGYTVETIDPVGGFTARRGAECALVYMADVWDVPVSAARSGK